LIRDNPCDPWLIFSGVLWKLRKLEFSVVG
jgi:hypothetical protein